VLTSERHVIDSRRKACAPAIVSLRAAGGFGEKPKEAEESSAKVSSTEKIDNPQAALDADVEELRKAMGADQGSTTLQGFGESSMEPAVPEKQVCHSYDALQALLIVPGIEMVAFQNGVGVMKIFLREWFAGQQGVWFPTNLNRCIMFA